MSWQLHVDVSVGHFSLKTALDISGQKLGLIGPNGYVKTTLLKTVAGAYASSDGLIKVGDEVLYRHTPRVDQTIEARRVGYVPQGFALFPHLSVLENLTYGVDIEERSARDRRKQAISVLSDMGCETLTYQHPRELSMGQRQRIAIARTLMISPRCLLLDEPLSALDPSTRRQMRRVLAKHLSIHQIPTLIVTHDQRDIFSLCDYVCVMETGRVIQHGSPQQVSREPINDFVAEFFDRPSPHHDQFSRRHGDQS